MSALHDILARAEENAAVRAAKVADIAKSKALLKEAEDAARKEHRQALGAVVRIRGAIEAVTRLPDGDAILGDIARDESCPTCVPVDDPAWLTEEASAPVPVIAPASEIQAQNATTGRSKLNAALAILIAEATNGYASIGMEQFAKELGVSVITARKRLDALVADGRIGTVKSRFPEPGRATFRILEAKAAAE